METNTGNRDRLLEAATEVFLEHGYGASVDMLVSRAGVARQTFYNHFQNKAHLFAEAMRSCVSEILVPLNENPADLRESLLGFARGYRQRVLSPQGIAKFRILTGQAPHLPELPREEFAQGLGLMLERLAQFLDEAMADGRIRREDPAFAAEMLMAMLAGLERTRLLYGVENPQQDENDRVSRIVDGYLRMFAVE